MTARILLVRHAEPTRAPARAIGRADVGLSREGARQARALAANLPRGGVGRVVSSPAVRARRTAEPIAEACDRPLDIEPDLREIDFGELNRTSLSTIHRRRPELLIAWMRAPTAVEFPGGETWSAVRARAERALAQIAGAGEQSTTVVVTHLGVILATLARLLPIPDAQLLTLRVDHGSTVELDASRTGWVLRSPPPFAFERPADA